MSHRGARGGTRGIIGRTIAPSQLHQAACIHCVSPLSFEGSGGFAALCAILLLSFAPLVSHALEQVRADAFGASLCASGGASNDKHESDRAHRLQACGYCDLVTHAQQRAPPPSPEPKHARRQTYMARIGKRCRHIKHIRYEQAHSMARRIGRCARHRGAIRVCARDSENPAARTRRDRQRSEGSLDLSSMWVTTVSGTQVNKEKSSVEYQRQEAHERAARSTRTRRLYGAIERKAFAADGHRTQGHYNFTVK